MAILSKTWPDYFNEFRAKAEIGADQATHVLKTVISEICCRAPDEYPSREKALDLVFTNFGYINGAVNSYRAEPYDLLQSFRVAEQIALLDAYEWAAPEKAERMRKKPTHEAPALEQ